MADELTLDDMDVVAKKDHYSFSQVNTFLRCPYQYAFRYLLSYKVPPISALVFGSSMHETLEDNYVQKIESYIDIPVGEAQARFANHWEVNMVKNVGMEFDEGESRESMLDEGTRMIAGYHEVIAPTIQPVVVEEPFTVSMPNISKPFVGRIDLIDINDIVVDHKNTKRAGIQSAVDKDFQTTMYYKAFISKYSKMPKGFEMHYLVRTKKPQYLKIHTTRTADNISAFEHTCSKVTESIERGIFYPNPHNFMCSEKGCGYWKFCKGGSQSVPF